MGVMMAGQQAAMGKYLAFSRGQEASADAAGAEETKSDGHLSCSRMAGPFRPAKGGAMRFPGSRPAEGGVRARIGPT